jgi:hypothetical protein
MPRTSYHSRQWRKYFGGLNVLSHFRLYGLIEFDIAKEGGFGFGLELPILELFKGLLAKLAVLPDCVELEVLEVVVVALERAEGDGEADGDVGLEDCTLGEDLEDSHVLAVESLPLLRDPGEGQPALETVGHLDLALAAEGERLCEAEVEEVMGKGDQLVMLVFQK